MDQSRQIDFGGPNTPQLMALVNDELRALAAEYMKRERPGHTLQPTALVNEAYLRLERLREIKWRDRTHFQAAASGVIRRVLVDHARARHAAKRGGDRSRVTLSGPRLRRRAAHRCRHPNNDAEASYEVIFPKRGVEGLGHGAERRVTFQV